MNFGAYVQSNLSVIWPHDVTIWISRSESARRILLALNKAGRSTLQESERVLQASDLWLYGAQELICGKKVIEVLHLLNTMCDIFLQNDVQSILKDKFTLFLGDSNTRALYKDLIWLLERNTLIGKNSLKSKLEKTFMNDKLLTEGSLHKGRDFMEIREYKKNNIRVMFIFITRCYTTAVIKLLNQVEKGEESAPDLTVINSCLWDISRWGPNGVSEYKDNMVKLMLLLKKCLPKQSLVVWLTTLPISTTCRGGFLIKQVEFLKHTLRFEVMEANMFTRDLLVSFGYDVLDFHYYFRMQIHRRDHDGIHWLPEAVRYMTNLLLTHVALSWGVPLPGNRNSVALDKMKSLITVEKPDAIKLPKLPKVFIEVQDDGVASVSKSTSVQAADKNYFTSKQKGLKMFTSNISRRNNPFGYHPNKHNKVKRKHEKRTDEKRANKTEYNYCPHEMSFAIDVPIPADNSWTFYDRITVNQSFF